jgi:ElaA protein
MTCRFHHAAFADLDGATIYALLRLRVDVFVVEQRCAYPELDDRDTEPGTRHLWLTGTASPPPHASAPGPAPSSAPPAPPPSLAPAAPSPATGAEPIAYLRIIEDPDGPRIGRVVTARHHRGRGLAGRLMDAALEMIGDRPVRLAAQVPATPFYTRYGFVVAGPEFLEDDIPHLPMIRRAAPVPTSTSAPISPASH